MTDDTTPDDGDEKDTETVRVQSYIPAYQKEIWDDHADTLGMTQSEFIRSMVQAGRRGFLTGPDVAGGHAPGEGDAGDPDLPEIVRDRVLITLRTLDHVTHEELAEIVTTDVEQALDAVLDDLQDESAIRHQRDGYTLVDDPEADDGE